TSSRIRADTVTSNPAARSTAASADRRGDGDPESSPMIRPLPLRHATLPGAGDEADRCTVPPITRDAGSTDAMKPPGSTLSRCRPAAGPPDPSWHHHGTPLRADSN